MTKLLKDYYETKELINQLKKELDKKRDVILKTMDGGTMVEGKFTATIQVCNSSILNKKKLIADFGEDTIERYIDASEYQKLNVVSSTKKAKVA